PVSKSPRQMTSAETGTSKSNTVADSNRVAVSSTAADGKLGGNCRCGVFMPRDSNARGRSWQLSRRATIVCRIRLTEAGLPTNLELAFPREGTRPDSPAHDYPSCHPTLLSASRATRPY